MNTIERLTAHLEEIDDAQLRGSGVEAVMEAGRRHNRRRIAVMTGGAVAFVAVLAFGANALQSAITDNPLDVTGEDRSQSEAAVSDLEWVGYESPLAYASRLVADDGAVYALTTAPGTRGMQPHEAPQAIFTTADGESWDHQVLGSDMWVSDLAVDNGVLYAIGTAPGVTVEDGGSVRLGTSDDEGVSWSYTDFPLAATKPVGLSDAVASTAVAVAAAGDTVVALATTQFWADYSQLVPPEFSVGNTQAMPTADGIKVIDWDAVEAASQLPCDDAGAPEGTVPAGEGTMAGGGVAPGGRAVGCGEMMAFDPMTDDRFTVYSATWEELGIDGRPGFSELFVADGGGEFEVVDSPLPVASTARIVAVEGGFVAYTVDMVATVWFSPDGRAWQQMDGLPRLDWIVDAGSVDGRIVVIGSSRGRPVVTSADIGGGAWVIHELPAMEGAEVFVGAGDVAPGGVALSWQGFDRAGSVTESVFLHSRDLGTWQESSLSTVTGPRSGGVESMILVDDRIDAQVFMTEPSQSTVTRLWAVSTPNG